MPGYELMTFSLFEASVGPLNDAFCLLKLLLALQSTLHIESQAKLGLNRSVMVVVESKQTE